MAEGKWISGLHEEMPVTSAAKLVIDARLNAVQHYLAKAVNNAVEDVEYVHQLRVSTRRAGAALRIFGDLLSKKTGKRLRRALKLVRRAAGEARDWDVFLEELISRREQADPSQQPGLDTLIGLSQGKRMDAQRHLGEATRDVDLKPLIADALDSLHVPEYLDDNAVLRDLAIPQLSEMLAQLERAALGDLSDYEHLHQVRIIGKRLRYAMEVFESCFGAPFREETYPAVEQMQEILGLANDSFVAVQRLEKIEEWIVSTHPALWNRYKAGIGKLLEFHRKRLPAQRKQFEDWWPTWRRAGADFALLLLLTAQKTNEEQTGDKEAASQLK